MPERFICRGERSSGGIALVPATLGDGTALPPSEAGIVYRDEDGRVADFHALRHTFISNWARSGVHPKVAQSLARHSTITLTMDRYSHTLIGEQADALKALPDLTGPTENEVKKTGTDDRDEVSRLASCLAFSERPQAPQVDSSGLSGRDYGNEQGNKGTPAFAGVPGDLPAEREGFEPSMPLRAYRFSRPTHSTTLPPLLTFEFYHSDTATDRQVRIATN